MMTLHPPPNNKWKMLASCSTCILGWHHPLLLLISLCRFSSSSRCHHLSRFIFFLLHDWRVFTRFFFPIVNLFATIYYPTSIVNTFSISQSTKRLPGSRSFAIKPVGKDAPISKHSLSKSVSRSQKSQGDCVRWWKMGRVSGVLKLRSKFFNCSPSLGVRPGHVLHLTETSRLVLLISSTLKADHLYRVVPRRKGIHKNKNSRWEVCLSFHLSFINMNTSQSPKLYIVSHPLRSGLCQISSTLTLCPFTTQHQKVLGGGAPRPHQHYHHHHLPSLSRQ